MSASLDNEEFRNLLYAWPEKAIAYLYEYYYDHLLRIADLYTRDRRLSEDALQEVISDIYQKHKTLGEQHNQSIQTYLVKAVSYHAITLYKKHLKTSTRETQYFFDTQKGVDSNVEHKIIASEKHSFLRLVMRTLPPRERQCLEMQIEEGLPVKVIARKLGITVKAVERNLTSAKKRVKKFRANLL